MQTQRTADTYMNVDEDKRSAAQALARLGASGKYPGNIVEDYNCMMPPAHMLKSSLSEIGELRHDFLDLS